MGGLGAGGMNFMRPMDAGSERCMGLWVSPGDVFMPAQGDSHAEEFFLQLSAQEG